MPLRASLPVRRASGVLLVVAGLLAGGCAELGVFLPDLPTLPPPGDASPEPRVFSLPGVVHRPTVLHPVRRITVDLPPGDYAVLELDLTVTNGGWSERRPRGTHNVFWLARESNRSLFGYVNIRNKNDLFLRHGIGQRHPEKARVTKRVAWPPGTTYRFHYLYDTGARRIELQVREGERLVATLRGTPNARSVRLGASQRLLLYLGFPGTENPNEPASLGWTYQDLEVRVR